MQHKIVHVNEADLIRDVQAFLNRVQEGFEIVIERDKRPVAVLRSASLVHHTISECIALAKAHEEETASAPTLDLDFIDDLKDIVASRKPWDVPSWD